jgi:hypothetical protein
MKDQHEKIKGYRDLSQTEIDLMNRIKEKGAELLGLQAQLVGYLETSAELKKNAALSASGGLAWQQCAFDECREYRRFVEAEPLRWAAIAKTDIQTGIMALVRAVAQPIGV